MNNLSSRLLRQSSLYALGNIALKASGLLLAVLYLNPAYLSVADFGYYGLLIVTSQFAIFIAGLGLGTGLLKFMTDTAYETARPALPFTTLLATVGSALLIALLFALTAQQLASLLLDHADQATLIYLLGGYVALRVISAIPLMVLRVNERAGWFALGTVSEMVFLIGGAYVLLVVRGLGLYGLMLAHVLAAGCTAVLLVGVMLVQIPWHFDRSLLRPLMRFGVPLVMASLAAWFLNAGDRYLLKWMTHAEALGLYEWAARLASVLNLVLVQSFQQAFGVIGLKVLSAQEGDAAVHRAIFRHYVIWGGWATLGLALLAYDLTRLLPAAAVYLQADDIMLFLALGFLANGVYYVIVNIVYGAGQTRAISLNVVGAAVLNIALNLALIPWLGVFGAAIATLISYLGLVAGANYFAQKEITVRFPWLVLAGVMGLVAGLYVLARPSLAWSVPARLALRTGLLLAYPVFIVLLRFYKRADLYRMMSAFRELLGRRVS